MAFNNKARGPRLRGLRYHIRENRWVYDRIRDLRFLDFEETIGFYIEFQERYGIDNESLRSRDRVRAKKEIEGASSACLQ
jgi:hypothetical protein